MKKILILILTIVIIAKVSAQQDPQFAHNSYNLAYTNPGFAGMNKGICGTVIQRMQWVGFDGAPKTTEAHISMDLKPYGLKGGTALSIADDRLGALKKFQVKLAYSYHKKIGTGSLGIGLEVGIMNFALDGSWKPPQTAEDPLIPSREVRKIILDLGIGAYYEVNGFYTGISISHIHSPNIKYPDTETASFLNRHFYLTAGYKFRLGNTPLEFAPSVHVKSDGTKIQQTYNLTGLYNKKVWLGVSYRYKDAIFPMAGIKLENGLTIGYAYEMSLSRLITVNKGTHEVMVGFCIDLSIPKVHKRYRDVRKP